MERTLRILIVEDEAVLRRTLTRLLERKGLMVLPAGNIREALSYLQGSEVDATILDVTLPDGDGLDLLPLTRVTSSLVVSAEVSDERLRDRGVEHFQRKPLDLPAVEKAIDHFLEVREGAGANG
jgi:DNA-binding response OmpR family regulator